MSYNKLLIEELEFFLKSSCNTEQFFNKLSPLIKHKNFLMHIAAPKTGSTWLTSMIKNDLNFYTSQLVIDYDRREQEIQLEAFYKALLKPEINYFFGHKHTRFSEYTKNFIEYFNVNVILQCRNIFDTVISVKDHLNQTKENGSMSNVPKDFYNWADEQQIDFIIDTLIPWYFNFYSSWFEYIKENKNIYLITYEDLLLDPKQELKKIYIKFNYNQESIEEILSKKSFTRFNKGILGRGEILNKSQKNKIVNISKYYKNVDFSSIGL
ncbi:sulfotransferase domain-containing protein [Arcobacter sp.]|uniref:sulfotransferase domain-containing protein n=1 Tax=Arcobacter sp. TaxID=1872629 RepID=UPI003D10E6DA